MRSIYDTGMRLYYKSLILMHIITYIVVVETGEQ